jgi:hypothetical protein
MLYTKNGRPLQRRGADLLQVWSPRRPNQRQQSLQSDGTIDGDRVLNSAVISSAFVRSASAGTPKARLPTHRHTPAVAQGEQRPGRFGGRSLSLVKIVSPLGERRAATSRYSTSMLSQVRTSFSDR